MNRMKGRSHTSSQQINLCSINMLEETSSLVNCENNPRSCGSTPIGNTKRLNRSVLRSAILSDNTTNAKGRYDQSNSLPRRHTTNVCVALCRAARPSRCTGIVRNPPAAMYDDIVDSLCAQDAVRSTSWLGFRWVFRLNGCQAVPGTSRVKANARFGLDVHSL